MWQISSILLLTLFTFGLVSIEGTQLSELPAQFLGLISNEIKQFYSGLSAEEQKIIDEVDASNGTETSYANAYKKLNEDLGKKAEEYVNKEAAKILKLDATARNFYLQILQLPNQLKLIGGGKKDDWVKMAKELLVQYEKLSNESKAMLKNEYPEVVETLTGNEFRLFAGFNSDENVKEKEE